MFKKGSFVAMVMFLSVMCLPLSTQAIGTLEEIDQAVENYYATGDIWDADVYSTLVGLVNEAYADRGGEAEDAIRVSIVDICNAFKDAGITVEAANAIIALAM